MKQIFEVIRQETTTEYCFIEANSEDEAREFAQTQDISWESAQTGESHITQIGIALPRLLRKGITIESGEGSYTYPKN